MRCALTCGLSDLVQIFCFFSNSSRNIVKFLLLVLLLCYSLLPAATMFRNVLLAVPLGWTNSLHTENVMAQLLSSHHIHCAICGPQHPRNRTQGSSVALFSDSTHPYIQHITTSLGAIVSHCQPSSCCRPSIARPGPAFRNWVQLLAGNSSTWSLASWHHPGAELLTRLADVKSFAITGDLGRVGQQEHVLL